MAKPQIKGRITARKGHLAGLGNYTVKTGDRLMWRQRGHGAAVGGLAFDTNQAASTTWSTTGTIRDQDGELTNADTKALEHWHQRVIDLTPLAGNQLGAFYLGNPEQSGAGNWSIDYADMALYSPSSGTTYPMFTGTQDFQLSYWGGGTNVSFGIQRVAAASEAVHFYMGDHLGTAQMELSSGGWPVWQGQFAPFGQELDNQPTAMHYKFTGKERDTESGLDYFGARYYGSSIGRFMSPDSGIDQHPEDPQSWNLYTYGRNNPLVLVDPSGEYVCGSNMSSQQCDNFQKGLDEAQKGANALKDKYGADSSQYKDAQRAVDSYGKQGVDNGVTIMAGKAGSDSITSVANAAGPTTADNPNGQKITVTLGTDKLDGSEGNGLDIGHEGSHVADGSDWVSSGFNPSMSPTRYGTEFRAFQVERNLAEGINWGPLGFPERSGPVYIWKPGWSASQVNAGINSELRQHYNLSPSSKILAFKQNTQGGH